MNKVTSDKLCEVLGVEKEEEFIIKYCESRLTYKMTDSILMIKNGEYWVRSFASINRLLEGEIIRLPWRPKANERYYIPDIFRSELFSSLCNYETPFSNRMAEIGLAFKTPEEAVEESKRILAGVKERQGI
jgi:hypothetical protein